MVMGFRERAATLHGDLLGNAASRATDTRIRQKKREVSFWASVVGGDVSEHGSQW